MTLPEFKTNLKELLTQDISIALATLNDKLNPNSTTYDEYIIFKSQLRIHERNFQKGIVSNSDSMQELNRIRSSVLMFINHLEEEDLLIKMSLENKQFREFSVDQKKSKLGKEKELFCKKNTWNNLEKIGRWEYHEKDQIIVGAGIYNYLLSSGIYGSKDFVIISKIRFKRLPIKGNYNAGIIFGWAEEEGENGKKIRRYYNVLFNKGKLKIEGIGLFGGDDINDFTHVDEGVEFVPEDDRIYDITIRLSEKTAMIFIDNVYMLRSTMPGSINGKVGLRPWRCQMKCEYFEITEL